MKISLMLGGFASFAAAFTSKPSATFRSKNNVKLSAGLYPGNPFPVMMPDEVSYVIYQSASIGAT